MKRITIDESLSGQRLDKLLRKYLSEAGSGFIYKMLRKKNIKLNNSKAKGNEILSEGDIIDIYLADDTLAKFTGAKGSEKNRTGKPVPSLNPEEIVYEDADIIILDKPVGELSQKADNTDISINERLLVYLEEKGESGGEKLFTPGVANRLDRNTSGMILAGKTLRGAQLLSEFIRERKIKKYYLALVDGEMKNNGETWETAEGYIKKDKEKNQVKIYDSPGEGLEKIAMNYQVMENGEKTLVEVELITGKTHQIRAYFSSIGHPLTGDAKYGSGSVSDYEKGKYYYLRAYKLVMPEDERLSERIRGKTIILTTGRDTK
ncbi:MAG: RluA family pseudouridine synthase [Eubacterium sp.]|nr:RluA family pseudouridine synthase [Eubacterium sp.]